MTSETVRTIFAFQNPIVHDPVLSLREFERKDFVFQLLWLIEKIEHKEQQEGNEWVEEVRSYIEKRNDTSKKYYPVPKFIWGIKLIRVFDAIADYIRKGECV